MSTDLVRRFAQLIAKPGTPAAYIDPDNNKAGSDSLQRAFLSGRAFFVVVRDTILAIDCDLAALVSVVDEIKAQLITEGLAPVIVQSGGEGRRHLFCLILDPRTMFTYKERVYRLGHGKNLEVRPFIRPPLSPHRLGLQVTLHYPEDPAEAIAALTPQRPKDLSPEQMDFLHHGAPKGQRSTKIQGCALAAINAGWTFGDYYWAMMDPANRGGEKVQGRPDAERYLERAWEHAGAWAKRHPPVQNRPEAIALIARIKRRVETWPWPKRAGETYRRVFSAYLTIAGRTGKLVFAASVREVAELAGVSIRAVVDANLWLWLEGWLRLHKGYQRGTADAASWRLKFPHGTELTSEQVRRLTLAGLRARSGNIQYRGGRLKTVPETGAGARRLLRRADQPRDPEAPHLRVDRFKSELGSESVPGTGAASDASAGGGESVPGTGTSYDLWRPGGLGARAGGIYRRLVPKDPISVNELALTFGIREKTVAHQLRRLRAHGLAVKTPAGWLRGDADLDAVAAELGVAGKGAAQREEHQRQRETFRDRLAGGDLRSGRDGR